MNGESGERVESWVARHRRWLWGVAGVVGVLVVVGAALRAPVEQWWLARDACGGRLDGGDLERVRSGVRLGAERESFEEERGRYRCVLESDQGKVVVAVDAYLDEAGREEELRFAGTSYPPHAVLPGGLPGFEGAESTVYLMPECPGGEEESRGERRRLLVRTWTYFARSPEEKAAMLRLAVRMTNVVSERLGCGGEALPEPEAGAVPDTGAVVARAEAEGTACDVFARSRVPEEWRDGTVRIAVADGGMVGRCTLRSSAESNSRPLVELTGWRGDWGTGLRENGSGADPLPMGDGVWKPALTEDRAWAVARCDGEKAGFSAHWNYDFAFGSEVVAPSTADEPQERRALLREYVAAFAEDQVRRGNCTDLRLPANP